MSADLYNPAAQRFALERQNIPQELQKLSRWVAWQAGLSKPNGKFAKVPVNPVTGRNVSANDRNNWMSFDDACKAYDDGKCSGIGIVLSDEPIGTWGDVLCGAHQYLAALDFDQCGDKEAAAARKIRNDLGGVYVEVSPSAQGLRMLALSRQPIKGGNAGYGRELYGSGRFMTVTGVAGRGHLLDATDGLVELERQWFPPKLKSSAQLDQPVGRQRLMSPLAMALSGLPQETDEAIAKVKAQLSSVSADCTYEQWRNVVWAVLSTQWTCAIHLAREWSESAPARYDERAFEQVVSAYRPIGGITLGTLDHHAREGGWKPARVTIDAASCHSSDIKEKRCNRLLTAQELRALPPQKWRIRGLFPTTGLAAIYGPSGSGKTFWALAVACAIAGGDAPWFGAKVTPANVVYMALEGQAGIQQRIAAWETHHGKKAPDSIRFLLGDFILLDAAAVRTLADEILQSLGRGTVIIVDTLAQSAPSADENSSSDMGLVIANAKALAAAVDGLVILVHHAGKDVGRGMRGHSSLFAAMDAVIEIASTTNGRAWKVAKSKDGISGVANAFELVPVTVGRDEDGAITSCTIRRTLPTATPQRRQIKGKNQITAYAALMKLQMSHPSGIPQADALAAVRETLTCEERRRTDRASSIIVTMTESGHLKQIEGAIFTDALQ